MIHCRYMRPKHSGAVWVAGIALVVLIALFAAPEYAHAGWFSKFVSSVVHATTRTTCHVFNWGCNPRDQSTGGGASAAAETPATQAATSAPSPNPSAGTSCPTGYTISQDGTSCTQNGYINCKPAGHPELMCPQGNTCTTDGKCQANTGGSCSSTRGEICNSAANSCGATYQGQRLCDGSCPASTPPDTDCAPPVISLSVNPPLVNRDSPCTVSWNVTRATTCSLSSDTGDSVASAALPSGSHVSQPITAPTIYSMICRNGRVVTSSASVTCRLNPAFQNL